MSNAASKELNALQRCAVCKIDLKGRFAFIDEEFLELTGYTYEELLGKPLAGIIDTDSQTLIVQLLNEKSHYETVFDSAPLTFVDKNQRAFDVTAIMFLNFIGGNPVNFQLIITTQPVPERIGAVSKKDKLLENFIVELSEIDTAHDWPGILQSLLKLSQAGQGAWYGFDKGSLVPMAAAVDESQTEFAGKEIDAPSGWHSKIAETEEEYDFTDGKSVQKAVESTKTAPNEFISTFHIHRDKYVLRLIFSGNIDSTKASQGIEKTRVVLPLIVKLVSDSK